MAILNERMTPEQFCYWLQGYFEITEAEHPEREVEPGVAVIRAHLNAVFNPAIRYTLGRPNPAAQGGVLPSLSGEPYC